MIYIGLSWEIIKFFLIIFNYFINEFSEVISWFNKPTAFGLIIISKLGFAGGANEPMAWTASEIEL